MSYTTHKFKWFTRPAERLVLLVVVSCMLLMAGCATPPGPIFPPLANAPKWPPPPDPARIFYVGQLVTSEDLKPGVSGLDAMGQAIFGKKDKHTMLSPFAVTTDNQDRLFVADSNAQLVHVFDMNTRKYAKWHKGGPKAKTPVLFAQPVGVAWLPAAPFPNAKEKLPPGRLLVSDSVAGTISVFDTNGNFVSELGSGILQRPVGIAIDPTHQRILVADVAAHQIVVLSYEGTLLERIGSRGTNLGQFNFPTNVAIDGNGQVAVCDSLNFRIQLFTPELKPLRSIGRKGDLPGYFAQPKAVATDSKGHLYILDAQFENVQLFDSFGRLLMDFGQEGNGPGEFWLPTAIFIDKNDRIWIADSYNRRVQVFDYRDIPAPEPATEPTTAPTTVPSTQTTTQPEVKP